MAKADKKPGKAKKVKPPPAVKPAAVGQRPPQSPAAAPAPAKAKPSPKPKAAEEARAAASAPAPAKPAAAGPAPATPPAPARTAAAVRTAAPAPVAPPAPAPVPVPDRGRGRLALARLTGSLGGASLCYGEPIHVGERIVVPIARVRGAGGYGFGRGSGDDGQGDGEGVGGAVDASPAGFLDITPDGVRYEAIPDPVTTARAISTAASGLAMLVGAAAGLHRMSRRRRRGLLPPG